MSLLDPLVLPTVDLLVLGHLGFVSQLNAEEIRVFGEPFDASLKMLEWLPGASQDHERQLLLPDFFPRSVQHRMP